MYQGLSWNVGHSYILINVDKSPGLSVKWEVSEKKQVINIDFNKVFMNFCVRKHVLKN